MLRYRRTLLILSCLAMASGCAPVPYMVSDDGAGLSFVGDQITYMRPRRADTKCRFNKVHKVVGCEDGTSSEMATAGLPFHGLVFVDFDGRRFGRESVAMAQKTPSVKSID